MAADVHKRTAREWLHEYLLTVLVICNVWIGVLVVRALNRQNDLQENWNVQVKVIADGQAPRSLSTSGFDVDAHPASLTVQQFRSEPPAALVDDLRGTLRAIARKE